ncbi:helicase-exonuclease AddAB subunit AddB [Peribacillus cavernae]|uniref:ATP-dependent helicase/deoxyribonuclease subunit B n=1 Tax=Peribacillus cavernae TaxID=1674310 RepID=A0A3S0W0J9_9BACI|nr:helicase-exonuclease AddAB subunit AddB [Peribacillus cavernae]MDQ0217576.1 ATP-dependent helicase/nuclease subunit B [Peribacillus cavernae]RUQ29990.1 helicase-exonuclease AddAB subunit AddB [Peribacillus cavernae]
MPLRFLLGRSGTGKTTTILNEIRGKLHDSPDGNPIIYLVPEQMTFLSEYKLIATPGLAGMIRSQVYSFTRLAWRVLQETGGMSRIHLDSVGVNMLIRKIIENKKDDLKMFSRSAEKQGFIVQLEEMLAEFKRYCVNPEEIRDFIGKQPGDQGLENKLHDLEVIYQAFEDELIGKYLDSEDYFNLLLEKMANSPYILAAEIYIDGFYSLTPQELLIVEELVSLSKGVTVGLTLDQPYKQNEPDILNLFRQTGSLYHSIFTAAERLGVSCEQDVILSEQERFAGSPALQHLEANFNIRPARPFLQESAVTVSPAVNRRAEVEGIARSILRLVREENYRWKDIAVLVRNGDSYHDMIQTVFRDYQIPVFIDAKRSMLNHPLIELIRSTLETLLTNWRYEPVFRSIKTELLYPIDRNVSRMRERVDSLENFVLSRGIKGGKWTSKERWTYRRLRGLELEERAQTDKERRIEDELNELKQMFTEPILGFSRRLKRAASGREYCEALYLYLEELQIPGKLDKWKLEAEDEGDLISAREYEQVWNAFVGLLDQYVEILGDEKTSLKQFSTIIETGMESMKFSLVPPAIDQVLVANLDLSRLDDVKAAFLIGLTEGVLPGKAGADGIFSDNDRDALLQRGLEVAPGSKIRLMDEEFTAYKAFMTPSEKLYLSYPLADEEGKSLLPSSYIKRIREVLPNLTENAYMNDPSDLPGSGQAEYAANYDVALSYLTAQLQLRKRNYPIHPLWWDVYNAYMANEIVKPEAVRVLSSLFYQNKAKKLSEDTSQKIYGENITASVSRMEMFNSCHFLHYAAHGLKLRERKIFRLDAPDIGEMFHGALKLISDYLRDHNILWASLTKKQCQLLAKEAVDSLAPKLQNEILLSTNRHHYLRSKLENIISRASMVLSEHAKVSGFSPIGLELGFGKDGQLPPLSFTLKNGTKMELVGRIDRVDKAEENDGVYLRVLDYKSSEKDLNFSEVYYGLALQMLTYLDIVVTHSRSLIGKEAFPAGVLYFHVHNPVVKAGGMLGLDEIEQALYKSFKMKGLLLGDSDVIQLMDQSLETGQSEIIPAGFKKDGTLQSKSRVASKEEFSLLNKHVRNMYQQAGDSIIDGKVDIAPYKLKDKTPCKFCSFKSVCQFDQSLEDNEFRILTPKMQEDVLAMLRKEAADQ